jgi:MFS transporter, DHA2 family, multidrug resistance protein
MRAWIGYALMCVGMFMAILDIQIVSAALPQLADVLHLRLNQLSWIQTAYLIAEVIAIAFSGRLARALSTTGLFTAAVAGFTLASIGCALSQNFGTLVAARAVQGLCGGAIIPCVFTAGFLRFLDTARMRAMLLAGICAMLAPSVGPLLGGFIAEKLAWQWIFLINVPAGIVVAGSVGFLLRVDEPDLSHLDEVDVVTVVALAAALALLMILLKVGPEDQWVSLRDFGLIAAALASGWLGIRRCLTSEKPLIDFAPLQERHVRGACILNFIVGAGLYGSVYVLPLFLGFVRRHSSLEIGIIMTVTGIAQLLSAPVAAWAEKHWPTIAVAGFGFALFTAGLLTNAFETPRSDAPQLFWPQVLRGAALLFCMLPLTTTALAMHGPEQLSHASALLNLMRNLGGALGIASVDTLINVRPAEIGKEIAARLLAGDRATAQFVGLPLGRFHGVPVHVTHAQEQLARPLVERAAATMAFNEAWLLLAVLMAAAFVLLPMLRSGDRSPTG